MKTRTMAAAVIFLSGLATASAELPMMNDKDWLGFFIGVENNDFRFGVGADGKTTLRINRKKGDPINNKLTIEFIFQIEETKPDGKTTIYKVLPESLETTQEPTTKPKNAVFRGKVKGDATIEVTLDETRGGISIGGRLLDPGTLAKDSLRFTISAKIPNAYADVDKPADRKETKAFEDRIKGDQVTLAYSDKKRSKLSTTESVDANSKEINGAGITAAEIEFSTYQGKQFGLLASPGSVLTLSAKQPGPLQDGFLITWVADAAKDPQGAARLNIEIK